MNSDRRDVGFRPDINGMRAIAVLGVIAFHFKLGPLRAGGFAGVDVFFVISGFLMTRIIVGRLDQSRFSLADFLLARTRRIVPAFAAMIVGILLVGLVLLNPLQLETQAERAAWSLPFLSNILYAAQGNYFVAPDQNWLLHTWSLSVEWQFYLIFPLVLIGLRAIGTRRRSEVAALLLLACMSFAIMICSLAYGGDFTSYNFYMLWSRAWEFLAGSLVAYGMASPFSSGMARRALHYSGLAVVFLSMMVFHNTTPWPSVWTALPVAGTCAVLFAGHEAPRWSRFAPVRLGGLWSYSIYLWHWPIAAILQFFDHWSLMFRIGGVLAALALGAISYVLIEQRATTYLTRSRRNAWASGLASVGVPFAFALVVLHTNGLETLRYAADPMLLSRLKDYHSASTDWHIRGYCDQSVRRTAVLEECKFGNPKAQDVLVLGDSFGGELTPRYKGTYADKPFGFTFATRGGCSLLPDTETIEFGSLCAKWTQAAYRYALDSRYQRVVFIAFWPFYEQGRLCLTEQPDCGIGLDPSVFSTALDDRYRRLGEFWRALKQQGKEVIVVGIIPIAGFQARPTVLYDKLVAGGATTNIDMDLKKFDAENQVTGLRLAEAATAAGVTLIDPGPELCPGGKCPVLRDGRLSYADGHHFRASMMKDPRFAIFDRLVLPGNIVERPIRPIGVLSNREN